MVIAVPPLMVPETGEIAVTVGAGLIRCDIGIAIGQGAALGIGVGDHDADCAGCVGRSCGYDRCALTIVTAAAEVPPSLTDAPAKKPVPVIVTVVPPLIVPEFGVMEVTVGAG